MTKPQTQKTTFKRDFEMRYGVSPETKPLGRNPDATEPNTRGDRQTVTPPGKHSPGPWQCPGTDGDEYVICYNDKHGKRRTVSHAYSEANARLIAAAPELLAACKRIEEQLLDQGWVNAYEGARLQAAIAKAEGKQ